MERETVDVNGQMLTALKAVLAGYEEIDRVLHRAIQMGGAKVSTGDIRAAIAQYIPPVRAAIAAAESALKESSDDAFDKLVDDTRGIARAVNRIGACVSELSGMDREQVLDILRFSVTVNPELWRFARRILAEATERRCRRCDFSADHELHYAGTVDSHAFEDPTDAR